MNLLFTDELLLHYQRCRRRSFLNVYGRETDKLPEKDFLLKLRQESEEHALAVLEKYYPSYHQPHSEQAEGKLEELCRQTEQLMSRGVDYIHQGKLRYLNSEGVAFFSSPTVLVKSPLASELGNWSYYPVSIQFGRRLKPEYKVIAAFHAYLLSRHQGVMPPYSEIILRGKAHHKLNLKVWLGRTQELLGECLAMLRNRQEPEVFIARQHCSLCQWHDSCHAIAKSQGHLSLVPGITPRRYESLKKEGILTVESLSQTPLPELSKLIESDVAAQVQKQATSIWQNTPLLKSNTIPSLPTNSIELYFDIEAEPERNIDYLLGVLLTDRNKKEQKYYTFLAENLAGEQKIWQDFLNFVAIYTDAPIFHYSAYEVETIKRLGQLYRTPPSQLNSLLSRLIDLHKLLSTSVILPIENYSLKSVANWLGFKWRNPFRGDCGENSRIISGDQCVCWYDRWLKTGDRFWLHCILRYNEDDCLATYHLKNWLVKYFNSWSKFKIANSSQKNCKL